jgi:uncharacterized membrane protein
VSTGRGTHRPPRRKPALIVALEQHLPYWDSQFVVLLAILIGLALPDKLTAGPTWLLPSLEGVLLIGLVAAEPNPRLRHSPLRHKLALALIAIVSAANVVSLVLLVHYLLHHNVGQGRALIFSGMALWVTNVLLFGLWYWELDQGGPLARRTGRTTTPDFLFPQMTQPQHSPEAWEPGMIDYLYVSFTNAAAFSPTDTMPLTPFAKTLMAAQALVALVTIGLVVARAVNIL